MDGRRVFVKRVPLTDTELLPEHARSTANVFGLPSSCHYGIGKGPGFGAWRELAVHTMTTDWVLTGAFPGFPLTHHWRVLPDEPRPLPEELADVDRTVAYWGGSPQVRECLEALRTATASLTLFLEYIPHTLHDWLDARIRTEDADAACALVERGLTEAADFLRERQLLHFDAHFNNILTDGRQLYFADYGLALSSRFRLTPRSTRSSTDTTTTTAPTPPRTSSTGSRPPCTGTAVTTARRSSARVPTVRAPRACRGRPPGSSPGTRRSPPC